MTKKELLEIVVRLQGRVAVLEKKVAELEKRPSITVSPPTTPLEHTPDPWPLIPSVWSAEECSVGGLHEYDMFWWGVGAQPCKKCGKLGPQPTVTFSGSID